MYIVFINTHVLFNNVFNNQKQNIVLIGVTLYMWV